LLSNSPGPDPSVNVFGRWSIGDYVLHGKKIAGDDDFVVEVSRRQNWLEKKLSEFRDWF
jgi:hypothetical protein